jgi:hypothetical protein
MRQIWIHDNTYMLLKHLASTRSGPRGGEVSGDQLGDLFIMEVITKEYPFVTERLEQIELLQKDLARELQPKEERYPKHEQRICGDRDP